MKHPQVILVAPCILYPSLQACAPNNPTHWGTQFSTLLESSEVKIIPLPCPESEFCGIPRKKHGIDYYRALRGYEDFCSQKAQETFTNVLYLSRQGIHVLACLGVEHSPSCAVSYMYSNRGMLKCKGLFFEHLYNLFQENNFPCEWIGINRTHPPKSYNALKRLLDSHR